MSLEAFNNKKDKVLKENYKATLKDDIGNENAIVFLKSINREKIERKRSVTFSITESQLNKINEVAQKNGFKSRSELLASIIDAI